MSPWVYIIGFVVWWSVAAAVWAIVERLNETNRLLIDIRNRIAKSQGDPLF